MSVRKARSVWETFHAKDSREELTVAHPWPEQWGLAGRAIRSFYSSDKWNKDGQFDDYYHDHSDGVQVWEPWGSHNWLEPIDLPSYIRIPDAGAILGYSLGWIIEKPDGTNAEAELYEDTFLCADPDGEFLFTVDPYLGVTALFCGTSLRIRNVGIVG